MTRRASMSPTALTLEYCVERNWSACIVERWMGRRRWDLWGFGDVLVMDEQAGSLIVQCTTSDHARNRVRKITEDCADLARLWLDRDNRIEVWGWGPGRYLRRIPIVRLSTGGVGMRFD